MRWAPALLGALITLHQPSGEIYVNGEEIMLVAPPRHAASWAKAEVTVHDKTIYVLETPAEVKRLRDGAE